MAKLKKFDDAPKGDGLSPVKKASLVVMAVFYSSAGVLHVLKPGPYLHIMPRWLPVPHVLVLASGICEVLLGVLLLVPRFRKRAAWGVILLLLAVFPANVQMTVDFVRAHSPYVWLTVIRLPLQGVLIYWAYRFTR